MKIHSMTSLYTSSLINIYCHCRATSVSLTAAFLVCFTQTSWQMYNPLCDFSSGNVLLHCVQTHSALRAPSPLLPPWHSHTGKYDRHPLWLPRLLDRSDRRRQQHSEEDYAQSLLWRVQSHLLGVRKTLLTKLTKINNYDRQRAAAALTNSPTLPFNTKTDMCTILSDEFRCRSPFLKIQNVPLRLSLFQYKPELFDLFSKYAEKQ